MAPSNRRLHWVNTVFPNDIDFPGHTDGLIVPSGLTSDRPASPDNGIIRYNTTTKVIEGYANGVWVVLGDSGTGGVTEFTDLSDTPNSYLTHANKLLRVNNGTTGVEFVDGDTLFLPLSGGTMNSGASITMVGATIKGVPAPQVNSDVANKQYVDAIAAGFSVKESVHSATTGPIDLTTQGLAGIDGHATYDDGDRVLVKDQVDPIENGIYAAHTTTWTRTLDMDGTPSNEVQGGTTTYVQHGTANGDTNWVVIWDGDVNVGTDPMNWSLVSAGSSQNLWETFQDDSAATITATGPTETLIVAGGTGITTTVAGTTLTITNDSPNVVQNVYGTITGDTGTAAASGDANILKIAGDGVTTSTAITNGPDVLTISVIGGPLASKLEDSDQNTFIDLEYAAPDSNNIRIQTGLNSGAAGGSIDIFASIGAYNRDGGGFNVTTGNGGLSTTVATPGVGGPINITSGTGGSGPVISGSAGRDGGAVQITSGDGGGGYDAGNGGNIIITSGDEGSYDASGTPGFGGDIILLPGGTGSSAGGILLGQAQHIWPNTDGANGEVLTTDGSGNLSFAASGGGGSSSRINDVQDDTFVETDSIGDGSGNTITMRTGTSTNHVAADQVFIDEDVFRITGLNGAPGPFSGTGGDIVLTSGDGKNAQLAPGPYPAATGGRVDLYAGNGGNGVDGGHTTGGSGGYMRIFAGDAGRTRAGGSSREGGAIRITAGKGSGRDDYLVSNGGTGGRIDIIAGAGGYARGAGGNVNIIGGQSDPGDYGGNGTNTGGDVKITGGDTSTGGTGLGGSVELRAGRAAYSGNGDGAIKIRTSDANVASRLQFFGNNDSNHVSLVAPSGQASDVAFVLPGADGADGEILTTDGAGSLKFTNIPVAPTYTKGALPPQKVGGFIYVSDATGASLTGSLCFSNGTVWIDTTTGAAVV